MSDVFIFYSHHNIDFVPRVFDTLETRRTCPREDWYESSIWLSYETLTGLTWLLLLSPLVLLALLLIAFDSGMPLKCY